jgi:hypothetical protein
VSLPLGRTRETHATSEDTRRLGWEWALT